MGLGTCVGGTDQTSRIDGDIPYGTDAGGDPFGLVVSSFPFFAGMQGNGDDEVHGTYRAMIRFELSRYLPSEQIAQLLIIMVFERMDQALYFPAFLVSQIGGGMFDPAFADEKLLHGIVHLFMVSRMRQVA